MALIEPRQPTEHHAPGRNTTRATHLSSQLHSHRTGRYRRPRRGRHILSPSAPATLKCFHIIADIQWNYISIGLQNGNRFVPELEKITKSLSQLELLCLQIM